MCSLSLGSICKYWVFVNVDTSSLKQIEQMHGIVKAKCFYSFIINSQPKLKKITLLFWRHLPRKTRHDPWCSIWVGDFRNFHNSFFIKNYYLNSTFFSSTAECYSPQSRKKNLLKNNTSHLTVVSHSNRQKKNI